MPSVGGIEAGAWGQPRRGRHDRGAEKEASVSETFTPSEARPAAWMRCSVASGRSVRVHGSARLVRSGRTPKGIAACPTRSVGTYGPCFRARS
jgi:hypothetical protein